MMAFLKPIFSSGFRHLSDLIFGSLSVSLANSLAGRFAALNQKKIFLGFSGCCSVFPVPSPTTFDLQRQQLKRILNHGASPKLSEIQTGSEARQRK